MTCLLCEEAREQNLLSCTSCGALLYADKLRELYRTAKSNEAEKNWDEALKNYNACLELLPDNTKQYANISKKIAIVSHYLNYSEDAIIEPDDLIESTDDDETQIGRFNIKFLLLSLGLLIKGIFKPRTLISMAVWVVLVQFLTGWEVAIALAGCIYIHEMGHIIAIHFFGYKFSWPFFVPFLGAFVMHGNKGVKNGKAWISIMGPGVGIIFSIICYLIAFSGYRQSTFLKVAEINTFLNFANLIPVWILDGKKVVDKLKSLHIILIGVVVMIAGGLPYNPLLLCMGGSYLGYGIYKTTRKKQQPAENSWGILLACTFFLVCGGILITYFRTLRQF